MRTPIIIILLLSLSISVQAHDDKAVQEFYEKLRVCRPYEMDATPQSLMKHSQIRYKWKIDGFTGANCEMEMDLWTMKKHCSIPKDELNQLSPLKDLKDMNLRLKELDKYCRMKEGVASPSDAGMAMSLLGPLMKSSQSCFEDSANCIEHAKKIELVNKHCTQKMFESICPIVRKADFK